MASYLKSRELVECPCCHQHNAVYEIHGATQAMWSLDEPGEVENVQLSDGFCLDCPDCGHCDAEPPQY